MVFVDRKVALVACVVVAFLLSASFIVLFYNPQAEDYQIRIIGRVNTDGSGIYLSDEYDDASDFIEIDDDGNPALDDEGEVQYIVDGWRGKVFCDPGTTTVQHVLLKMIVEDHLGLSFKAYTTGATLSDDSVYYLTNVTTAEKFMEEKSDSNIAGGIIWEAQYGILVLEKGCTAMMTSSYIDSGHSCCVIAAKHAYTTSNNDTTTRFLAAVCQSVERINKAVADTSSSDYNIIVDVLKTQTSIDDDDVIKEAMDNINYTVTDPGYSEGSEPLSGLKESITELIPDVTESLKNSIEQMGFSNTDRFADVLVDEGYLLNALSTEAGSGTATIKVACISEDIHTILPIYFGIESGIFSEYGISLEITQATNGSGVMISLCNGEADIGLMGLAPAVISSINNELVEA